MKQSGLPHHDIVTSALLFSIITFCLLALVLQNCTNSGLVTEKVNPDLYPVTRLSSFKFNHNPRFVIYGDSRPGWLILETLFNKENWQGWRILAAPWWITQGVVATVHALRGKSDYGKNERMQVRRAILQQQEKQDFDFILSMGDFITDGRQAYDWQQFLIENRHQSRLLNDIPFVPVVGNHEHVNDSRYGKPNYQAVFAAPQFYTLEFPAAEIFIIDTDFILDQYQDIQDDSQNVLFEKWFVSPKGAKEKAWLEKKLANCSKKFKIVAMHHPPVSFGVHHADWFDSNNGPGLIDKLHQLLDLFHRYGVRLILASHEHYYEHSTLKKGISEIELLIGGGGGVPLRSLPDNEK